jgi:hypothetical protein
VLGEHRRLSDRICSRLAARERVVRAALAWEAHADPAAVERDAELTELAAATRALIEAGDAVAAFKEPALARRRRALQRAALACLLLLAVVPAAGQEPVEATDRPAVAGDRPAALSAAEGDAAAFDPFAGMDFDDRLELQEEVEPEPEPTHPRILAAGWCVVGDRGEPAPVEGGGEEVPEEDGVGCDLGVGAELVGRTFRQGRLSAVVVGGTKSIGAGVSWAWMEWDRPVAVGVLIVAPFDSSGIYADGAAVALAATVGLFGGGGGNP